MGKIIDSKLRCNNTNLRACCDVCPQQAFLVKSVVQGLSMKVRGLLLLPEGRVKTIK